ncbi:uncharacterized protein LOC126559353 [Anopheles maculipalpis]|uniref:uncharacterized protein LOC126559353 n=1 Tax=Anopheles maculipalpis TaxID=1496333 RepID=UPI002158AB4A|nr:uncharacterized protein LOC126559353 [Anopheles maculipalpis]
MAFAGNIQTFRKNCPSQCFPFKIGTKQRSEFGEHDFCTEYDNNFMPFNNSSKPVLRRDQMREVYKEKITLTLTKNANEQLETLHRQEEERKQLRKRMNYYMAKDNERDPQYSLQRTDDVVTFWSYRIRRNANHRRNNDFTKPHDEKLDVQFE